jgi:hypothetical protein
MRRKKLLWIHFQDNPIAVSTHVFFDISTPPTWFRFIREWRGWYDCRGHRYTIVDTPNQSTVLTADKIEQVFLEFGGPP